MWVQQNPKAAAQLAVDKKPPRFDGRTKHRRDQPPEVYPSVTKAEQTLYTAAKEMREAKMLAPNTDTDALAKKAFHHLDGVTDEWIKTVQVEKSPEVRSTQTRTYGSTPSCSRKIPKIPAAEESSSISRTRTLPTWPTLTPSVCRRIR